MRRTFASLLYAIGEPPPVVMAEMGHTNPALALRIYAQAMRRDDCEVERLRALVDCTLTGIVTDVTRRTDTGSAALASPQSSNASLILSASSAGNPC